MYMLLLLVRGACGGADSRVPPPFSPAPYQPPVRRFCLRTHLFARPRTPFGGLLHRWLHLRPPNSGDVRFGTGAGRDTREEGWTRDKTRYDDSSLTSELCLTADFIDSCPMFSPQPLATPPALPGQPGEPFRDPFELVASSRNASKLSSSLPMMRSASSISGNSLTSPVSAAGVAATTAAVGVAGTPGSMIRAISPPTPAPSPQPADGRLVFPSNGSPSWSTGRPFDPATPLSPNMVNDQLDYAQSQALDAAFEQIHPGDFAEQFTQSVVAHFPRLSGPERRKLFTALLPMLLGEDLLHLSQLISPFLRRDFLAELPAEISLHVLGFIDDPKDLVRASRVSKTWRGLVMDEQTWKAMLQKYRGRGWWSSGEGANIRPPIERIRQSHPEATFSAVTSPPAAPTSRRNTLLNAGPPPARQSFAGGLLAPAWRTSALSPTAQPFQSRRQSVSIQAPLAEYAGPVASTSAHQPNSSAAGSGSSEVGVNRFLDENQTPATERRKRIKGKGRQSTLEAESVGAEQAGPLSRPAAVSSTAYAIQGLGFSARRQSHQVARSPNAPIQQPIPGLMPPPPQDLATQISWLSMAAHTSDSHIHDTSPSARFTSAYTSPEAGVHPALSGRQSGAYHPLQRPPTLQRRTSFLPPTMPLSTPQAVRYHTRKSQNPFGTAVVTTPSLSPMPYPVYTTEATASSFSYKKQFKKAYLTESNWLKGPGRLLSRQTSADDAVVTSLGFDNDWIIVGMATNQLHVFDSRTGEYARQLEGHALGVWCLVLVSKGGTRLDKDGKKAKIAKTSWESDEDSVEEGEITDADEEAESETACSADEADRLLALSQNMPRCRSASARPPDRERFFHSDSPLLPEAAGSSAPPPGAFARTKSTPAGQSDKPRPSVSSAAAASAKSRRPSSFCGLPTADERRSAPTGSGLFGDSARFSQQQAAACGTATGWGQRGAIAVTGGCDRDVRVWDVETG